MIFTTIDDILNLDSIWVFGYGSLLWKPEFDHIEKEVGYISGYERRFWQGSVTHRGCRRNPGRVATLVKSPEKNVWGVAFKIEGKEAVHKVMHALNLREMSLGGYDMVITSFTARDARTVSKNVFCYMANPDNSLFMGPDDTDIMAYQILAAKGFAGTNVEYVTKTAEFIRENVAEETDEHLFTLDLKLRQLSSQTLNVTINISRYSFWKHKLQYTDDSNSDSRTFVPIKM